MRYYVSDELPTVPGTGWFWDALDPRQLGDGLQLQSGSPAINAGIDPVSLMTDPDIRAGLEQYVYQDINGATRPQGLAFDLGAYEYRGIVAPTRTPTPSATITSTSIPTSPTSTPTETPTNTPTDTPTDTPTGTRTELPINTPINTSTPTHSPTNTPTRTRTPILPTITPILPTNTPTNTYTRISTPTNTRTITPTPTRPTNTPTPTTAPSNTSTPILPTVTPPLPTFTPPLPTFTPPLPTFTPLLPTVTPIVAPPNTGTPTPTRTATPGQSPGLLWRADHETGDLSQWTCRGAGEGIATTGDGAVYATKDRAHGGSWAAALQIQTTASGQDHGVHLARQLEDCTHNDLYYRRIAKATPIYGPW